MRILEVNKFYYPRRGAERHFLDLVSLLRSEGHEVGIFAMKDPKNVPSPYERYFVSAVGYNDHDSTWRQKIVGMGRLFWSFEARANMRRLLRDFDPEIAHIHNAYHQLSFSFLSLLKKKRIPVLMTVHDYHMISPDKDEYYPKVGSRYWRFLFVKKYAFPKRLLLVLKSYWESWLGVRDMIDTYIAPSWFVKKILVSGGIPESKIAVIPHFVMPAPSASETAEKPAQPYALYFGGVTEEKNILELAHFFDRSGFQLLLAGQKTFPLPESPWVKYVGEKTSEDITKLIRGSAFVVSASRLPETFGLIILEANREGKPFFGYATGAFPELVTNGKNGWLGKDRVEFESYITRFIQGDISCEKEEVIRTETLSRFGATHFLEEIFKLIP